jgi:hypothetical protein
VIIKIGECFPLIEILLAFDMFMISFLSSVLLLFFRESWAMSDVQKVHVVSRCYLLPAGKDILKVYHAHYSDPFFMIFFSFPIEILFLGLSLLEKFDFLCRKWISCERRRNEEDGSGGQPIFYIVIKAQKPYSIKKKCRGTNNCP